MRLNFTIHSPRRLYEYTYEGECELQVYNFIYFLKWKKLFCFSSMLLLLRDILFSERYTTWLESIRLVRVRSKKWNEQRQSNQEATRRIHWNFSSLSAKKFFSDNFCSLSKSLSIYRRFFLVGLMTKSIHQDIYRVVLYRTKDIQSFIIYVTKSFFSALGRQQWHDLTWCSAWSHNLT